MIQEVEVVALQEEGRGRWGSLLQGVLQGDKQVSHWLFKIWEDSCLSSGPATMQRSQGWDGGVICDLRRR
jgi:hypothetical protein